MFSPRTTAASGRTATSSASAARVLSSVADSRACPTANRNVTAAASQKFRTRIAPTAATATRRSMPMLRAVTLDGYVMMNGQYCFDETGVFRELALPAAGMQALVDWLHTPAGQQELVCFVERDFSYLNRPIGPGPGPVEADTPVLDPARALTHPTYQLNAYLPPEREANFLAHCPGCVAVRWCDTFADILPAGGGKPAGLAAMLDHLGLRREESIAFGDGGNDISMLEYAGVGVAMGNALPAVKAAADYVTDSVDADGVEKALQHFGLI